MVTKKRSVSTQIGYWIYHNGIKLPEPFRSEANARKYLKIIRGTPKPKGYVIKYGRRVIRKSLKGTWRK